MTVHIGAPRLTWIGVLLAKAALLRLCRARDEYTDAYFLIISNLFLIPITYLFPPSFCYYLFISLF